MPSHEDSPHRPATNTGTVADGSASGDGARLSPVDVSFLIYIPVILAVVFLLPMELRRELALLYTEPSLRSMYASHFVHFDFPHLAANLLVYLLVVPFSLVVSVWSGRRRRFYLVAFTILVVFPLVLSGLNVLFPRPRIGMGFSGMNLAFVGYLPHVLAARFEAERPEWKQTSSAFLQLAFFLGTAIVTVRVAGSLNGVPRIGFEWLSLAGAGSLLGTIGYTRPVASCLRSQGLTGGTVPPLAAFGSLLFVLLVIVGFPEVSPEGLPRRWQYRELAPPPVGVQLWVYCPLHRVPGARNLLRNSIKSNIFVIRSRHAIPLLRIKYDILRRRFLYYKHRYYWHATHRTH